MADAVPVPVAAGALVASPALEVPYNRVIEGLARLPVARQLGVMVGLAATMAIAIWLVLWTRDADLRPLYGSLENLDAASVINVLESNEIQYRLDPGTGMLLVESARYDDARLKLAEAGMPSDNAVGFEMLEQEQGLGTSQFMETARFRRSLEGELARTISGITTVRSARVHLAIPERTVFVRDRRKPSASVLLDVVPGRAVEPGQVRAIGNLVASSVPELALEDVTIVDQKGKLLSDFARDEQAELANTQLEHTQRIESQVVERVHRILDPLVGNGRYKAEASADVDYTAIEQTDEVYNPDLPAIRSEQSLEEKREAGAGIGAGIPGALSNQPPAGGQAPEVVTPPAGATAEVAPAAPAQDLRTQSTRNYELDRSLSYTRHQVGRLRRLTVAVVLDHKYSVTEVDGESTTTKTPWETAELERITRLVRDAVGYDASRGDSVDVLNAPFHELPVEAEEEIASAPIWEHTLFWPSIRMLLGAIAVLLLIFAVVRPVLRGLSSNVKQLRALEERHRLERQMAENAAEAERQDAESLLLPAPNRDFERRRAAVQAMVEGDAEKVAQVVKKWVREGE